MRTRSRTTVTVVTLFGMLSALLGLAPAAQAATGFRISDGRLIEGNGNDFVMRGVNHAHAWYPDRIDSLTDIKALGANTVRVVLSTGDQWTRNDTADVAGVVAQCKRNKLICVLEAHDTTGYGEQSAAVTLDRAADYWISVQSALTGQEDYVLVNLGNEPYGNSGYSTWAADTGAAVQKLRTAGFDHTLVADAPNWGQDWSFTMRDNAASVFAADPDRNTLFSIHMYGVFDTSAEISAYLNHFVSAGLPIIVGEFGHDHSDGNPDEDAILSTTQSLGLGYLGWSWSGNGGGVEYLDMANDFNAASLTTWGRRIFDGANGIARTSEEAAVYSGGDGGGDDTTAPSTPGTPTASDVTSFGVRLSWPASSDAVGVTGYDVVRINGTAETVVASSSSLSASVTGLGAGSAYTFGVYARDAAGNRSARSAVVNVTTGTGGGTPAGCSVVYKVANQWTGGFQGDVKITNTGESAVNGWTLVWNFPDGQKVSQMWGGTYTQDGSAVSATAASYTAVLPVNGSVSVGFIGNWDDGNSTPTAFTLNSIACSVS